MPDRIDDYEALLTKNTIWLKRTQGVGRLSAKEALSYGVTGPVLRASGGRATTSARRSRTAAIRTTTFEIPVGTEGDVYDRYLVRIEEMRQSVRILDQALKTIPERPRQRRRSEDLPSREGEGPDEHGRADPPVHDRHRRLLVPRRRDLRRHRGAERASSGFYIVSEGGKSPYRCRIRSSAFNNLSSLKHQVEGELVADVVACIGSIDPVMGEVDR